MQDLQSDFDKEKALLNEKINELLKSNESLCRKVENNEKSENISKMQNLQTDFDKEDFPEGKNQ